MKDLIDRQAAIDEIDEWIKAFRENGHKESAADACLIQDGIIQLPSAQPERKKGRWINRSLNVLYPEWERYTCSVCGKHSDSYDYCPNCGADMRQKEESDV